MLFATDEGRDVRAGGAGTVRPAYREPRLVPLTEEVVLNRLERVVRELGLPPSVASVLLEALCPDATEEPEPAAGPTKHLPGTPERLAVMEARAARGESLYHPGDAQWEATETLHLEQAGELLRTGKIRRPECEVRERRGGNVVDIGTDPEKAADAIRRHFKGDDLVFLAGLLWEGLGWRGRRDGTPAPEAKPAPRRRRRAEVERPARRVRPGRRRLDAAGQLLLWP